MAYLGHSPTTGDNENFRLLDDISTHTLTFDGSSASIVSTTNNTITKSGHRFVQGQRVTYTHGGGGNIGGLTSGTVYYIIDDGKNTIKLASSASNAASLTALNISSVGSGTAHTLNVAFDGVNTKFTASFNSGTKASIKRAAQLSISINGVMQQPYDSATPTNGYGHDSDSTIVFSTAPASTDVFWGYALASSIVSFNVSDNDVDTLNGNGSTTSFTLSKVPASAKDLIVTIDGVVQYPSDGSNTRAYSLAANVLTFVSAPANGTVIQARHIGFADPTVSGVTGFYGRTGNVSILDSDSIVAIQSAGTSIGTVRTLNFVGTGNSIILSGNTVDVSISGGGADTGFSTATSGIHTTSNVGINTNDIPASITGVGNSFQGMYVSNGMLIYDNELNGNHYIGTNFNGLMAGPVVVNGSLTVDGHYVVV